MTSYKMDALTNVATFSILLKILCQALTKPCIYTFYTSIEGKR